MTDQMVVDDVLEEFDLDAAVAEQAKSPLGFRWKGQSWKLKHPSSVDWRIIEAATSGDIDAIRKAFEYGMGKEQAARFDKVEQDMDAMTILFRTWLDHAGTSQGESPASADSSASTEKQSRPASPRTTRASGSRSSSRASSRRAS